jgi:hypothetical protein
MSSRTPKENFRRHGFISIVTREKHRGNFKLKELHGNKHAEKKT